MILSTQWMGQRQKIQNELDNILWLMLIKCVSIKPLQK